MALTGEQWDADLGFYYLRARYNNPQTGRFWTMDSYDGIPFDPATLHKYIYTRNSPVDRSDPSGYSDTGSLGGTLVTGSGYTIVAGLPLPVISLAKIQALAKIGAVAIAVAATATIPGHEGDRTPTLMRLQFQEGTRWHYWSAPIPGPYTGVTRNQVQRTLYAMWNAFQLLSEIDWENNSRWDRFDQFGRWEKQMWSAVIRMSEWVGSHGPTDGTWRTVHQEYANPLDTTSPRLDLENIRGVNLRQ